MAGNGHFMLIYLLPQSNSVLRETLLLHSIFSKVLLWGKAYRAKPVAGSQFWEGTAERPSRGDLFMQVSCGNPRKIDENTFLWIVKNIRFVLYSLKLLSVKIEN